LTETGFYWSGWARTLAARSAGEQRVQPVEVEEDDRGRIEGQRLADDKPADDRIAPNGWRISAPVPVPSINGTPPE